MKGTPTAKTALTNIWWGAEVFTGSYSTHTPSAKNFVFHASVSCSQWRHRNSVVPQSLLHLHWLFCFVKMPLSLTSDVLHGDGAGSCEFPRHPKGFVAQLLVHQCTLEKKIQEDLASKNPSRSHWGSLDKWLCDRLTSFVGRFQQQVDRIQREDGDGCEQNPVKRREGSSAEWSSKAEMLRNEWQTGPGRCWSVEPRSMC